MAQFTTLKNERLNTKIPSSLRHVAPFLEEALCSLRNGLTCVRNLKIAICCMDHAFAMLNKFDFELDTAAVACLETFESLRMEAAEAVSATGDEAPRLVLAEGEGDHHHPHHMADGREISGEDILLAEANSTLEVADQQFSLNLTKQAARNYHTSTIYFRVINSTRPLDAEHLAKMEYGATRTRQCSHLLENFVLEHFTGSVYYVYLYFLYGKHLFIFLFVR